MRSVFLIGIVVFAAIVAGGYSIGWYAQAARMQTALEQAIANVNTRQQVLTYQTIETSGFPGDITLSLVNPKFSGRADLLLKSLPAQAGRPNPFADLPAWQEEDSLNGRIDFTVNPLSSHYRLGISGSMHHASTIGGQTQTADISRSGEAYCLLALSSGNWMESLWDYQSLLSRGRILNHFRMLDCDSPGYLITGPKREPLAESAPARLYIVSIPSQGIEKLRVYLKINGTDVTPAGDAWLTAFSASLGRNMPSSLALYGKQTAEINLTYVGPDSAEGIGKEAVDLRLDPFKLQSAASHTGIALYFTDSGPTTPREAHLHFQAVAGFDANYAAIQQNMLQRIVAGMYADKSRLANSPLAPAAGKYTPDQMAAILAPAMPHLQELSPLTGLVDASYKGSADFKTGDATLSSLEISAAPYGITGKGGARLSAGLPPAGNVTLVCAHCLQLVDDLAAYTGRLQKALSVINPAAAVPMQIDPGLVAGFKNFLSALAVKDASGNNYTFAIASSGSMNASINGKALPEITQLYDQTVGAALRQEQAEKAAQSQAPAPQPH